MQSAAVRSNDNAASHSNEPRNSLATARSTTTSIDALLPSAGKRTGVELKARGKAASTGFSVFVMTSSYTHASECCQLFRRYFVKRHVLKL